MNRKFLQHITFIILLLGINAIALSQSGKVPPFRIIQPDGKPFFAANLPLGKPIIIIYFSPDCDECKKLTTDLLDRMIEFKKASIAMITYLPVESLKQFVTRFEIKSYSNIFIGTEGNSLFVRNYYNINRFPFIALYTQNGDLVKKYDYTTEDQLTDLSYQLAKIK